MRIFCYIFFVLFLFYSCNGNSQEKKKDVIDINEQLTRMNQLRIQNESKKIDEFIINKKFKTERTGTGLRYEIYVHGNGEKPLAHSEIEIKFKLFLLDGKLCYSSDSGSVKFRIGENEQVRGLEEGIMLMSPGDKAHLIMPAHLGYGLSGDQGKIPPASSLFYDVELINVKK